jgi:hypothetical protein
VVSRLDRDHCLAVYVAWRHASPRYGMALTIGVHDNSSLDLNRDPKRSIA